MHWIVLRVQNALHRRRRRQQPTLRSIDGKRRETKQRKK